MKAYFDENLGTNYQCCTAISNKNTIFYQTAVEGLVLGTELLLLILVNATTL
jgi:hypothetical protein